MSSGFYSAAVAEIAPDLLSINLCAKIKTLLASQLRG